MKSVEVNSKHEFIFIAGQILSKTNGIGLQGADKLLDLDGGYLSVFTVKANQAIALEFMHQTSLYEC